MFLSGQYSMEDCKKMDVTVDCFLLGEVGGDDKQEKIVGRQKKNKRSIVLLL